MVDQREELPPLPFGNPTCLHRQVGNVSAASRGVSLIIRYLTKSRSAMFKNSCEKLSISAARTLILLAK